MLSKKLIIPINEELPIVLIIKIIVLIQFKIINFVITLKLLN